MYRQRGHDRHPLVRMLSPAGAAVPAHRRFLIRECRCRSASCSRRSPGAISDEVQYVLQVLDPIGWDATLDEQLAGHCAQGLMPGRVSGGSGPLRCAHPGFQRPEPRARVGSGLRRRFRPVAITLGIRLVQVGVDGEIGDRGAGSPVDGTGLADAVRVVLCSWRHSSCSWWRRWRSSRSAPIRR